MSTIVNARDVLLQAAPERIVGIGSVQWSDITGVGKPADFADVTEDAFNQGVSVTQITGGLQLHSAGAIKAGQSDFNSGTGFFLGYSGGTYKFSLGSPIGNAILWDGTNVTLRGNLDFSYVLNGPPANANNTTEALNSTSQISSGGITMLGGGSIKGGQTDYNTGNGFFLGWSNGYKLSIGVPSGNSITWNGTTLAINGQLIGGSIKLGTGLTPGGYSFEVVDTAPGYWSVYMDMAIAGAVYGDNSNHTGTNATPILGVSTTGFSPGVYGTTAGPNTGQSHGVVGYNQQLQTIGYVGASNGYDFYAAGNGTNYGPFTGTHDGLVKKVDGPFPVGHIVVDVDVKVRNGWSSTLCEVALSTVPNQPGALGVICAPEDPIDEDNGSIIAAMVDGWVNAPLGEMNEIDKAIHRARAKRSKGAGLLKVPRMKKSYYVLKAVFNHVAVNAVGEGQMLVCGEGGNLALGDLIVTSSMPGKGMKQADNFLRNYTVAKARESVTFSGPTDVKTVACIYLCG